MRLPLEIVELTRSVWPKEKPLFIRISASDWYPEGEKNDQGEWISWGIEQSKVSLHPLPLPSPFVMGRADMAYEMGNRSS
jgi:2,4-dienoyl-CoA reductase-like NADH-dependent reductase (Old Yellow Enzyme family)